MPNAMQDTIIMDVEELAAEEFAHYMDGFNKWFKLVVKKCIEQGCSVPLIEGRTYAKPVQPYIGELHAEFEAQWTASRAAKAMMSRLG